MNKLVTTWSILFAAAAAVASAVGGWSLWRTFEQWRRRAKHRERAIAAEHAKMQQHKDAGGSSLDEHVIRLAERDSRSTALGHGLKLPSWMMRSKWFERQAAFAGLEGSVSVEGFCQTRIKLTAAGASAGTVLGLMFSAEPAVVLAVVGGFFGWRAPTQAIRHRTEWRAHEMERHLPEMLDVVAIGMRSGLSFDRSLEIYFARFDTLLARELELAQRKWSSGLERRDAALRKVAASYDSIVFSRVTEATIRALRFGSSMIEGLEAASAEARTSYRTRRQEQVAKAPVKMMVPTGTLILPAMLIMVLGPVLLEMIGGGF